jgi:hypothetical protein
MGYRGEDASHTRAGRQAPWQSSSGNGSSGAGSWDDRSQGYSQDSGDYGHGPADTGGFGHREGYGQQGYGQQGYGQQGYAPYDGYRPDSAGQGTAGQGSAGYGGAGQGWGGQDGASQGGTGGYGAVREPARGSGYQQPSYDQAGYGRPGSGVPDETSYDLRDARGPGYQDPGSGGYPRPDAGGYQESGTGGYRQQRGRGYQAQDAGNDWYGGQPAAASGASFADTGTYQLNGRVIDEYGTGPRQVLRDPVRGYPPTSGPQARMALPAPALPPATSGAQAVPTGGRRGRHSGQQDRFADDYDDYPGQGRGQTGPGRAAPVVRENRGSDGYPVVPDRDGYDDYANYPAPGGFDEPGGPSAEDYDDYAGEPGGYGYQASPDGGRRGYDEYADDADPYESRYGEGPEGRGADTPARGARRSGGTTRRAGTGGRRSLLTALAVFTVAVAGVAAYVFISKGNSTASNPNAAGAIPSVNASSAAQQECARTLGTYCHIQLRSGDPKPLTVSEVFPPEFQNTTDKTSYSLAVTKLDKTCGNAVFGTSLTDALKNGHCTQVLRASYLSGDSKIMGTIGVVNLSTTTQAHYAGKVVGAHDFIKPLEAPKGLVKGIDNGTGLVEAEFKGHYLILTWCIYVNGNSPTTDARVKQLEQFARDLVAGTVNIPLSQRMVTGAPAGPGTA